MERLIGACSLLTLFEFVVPDGRRYRSMSDVGYEPLVAPRELATALLRAHGPTLRTVHLDFYHFYRLRDREIREQIEGSGGNLENCDFTFPSFRDCENLTDMTVEFEKIIKFRHLPASLVSLQLEWCYFEDLDIEYLRELIQLKETWCPAIESVIVSGWEKSNEGIVAVREHARLLEAPVHFSEDGRVLTFLGATNYLQIQSREPPSGETWAYDEESSEEEDVDDDEEMDNEDAGVHSSNMDIADEDDGDDNGYGMELSTR
jgi:hypothetical protein